MIHMLASEYGNKDSIKSYYMRERNGKGLSSMLDIDEVNDIFSHSDESFLETAQMLWERDDYDQAVEDEDMSPELISYFQGDVLANMLMSANA